MDLHPPQAEVIAYGLLDSGFSCLLQMATGSGKTWLAEHAIETVLRRGQRAIYVAPLRALASELGGRWGPRFPQHRVGVFTGDVGVGGGDYPVAFQDAQLLIMTPERLDLCTRSWRRHWHWIPDVDLLVVDEFHVLGEGRRGARLEGAMSRFRRLNPFVRVLGLSATLGNRGELADWLDAVEYESAWRPVPLTWHVVRYRRAEDKPKCLLDELTRCRQTGGKSLVFVQSRRRAEFLASYLRDRDLRATHHHAGLDRHRRREVEEGFRGNDLDVLVATSTLEMGLNLPVRTVVLYDLQGFDGTSFVPLSTNTVWQRVGRAGRPGLDSSGEAVLLAPAWDKGACDYQIGRFERIRSTLDDERALGEQLVVEVASGFGRTETQLTRILMSSLAARQGALSEPKVRETLGRLLAAGMLQEVVEAEVEDAPTRLAVTPLGRVAVRHMLYPATVAQFQRLADIGELTFFDLLLAVSSVQDCEPLLPVDYEELETLAERATGESSHLLHLDLAGIVESLGVNGKRLLASLKMALAVRQLTRSQDPAEIAPAFGCYPFELDRLTESVERLLLAMGDLLQARAKEEGRGTVSGWQSEVVTLAERVAVLQRMVTARLDEVSVTLTWIEGVGPTLARRLVQNGIADIRALARATPQDVAQVKGISLNRAEALIGAARVIVAVREPESYREGKASPLLVGVHGNKNGELDPYRLRRARELSVSQIDPGRFRVTGGTDPHEVSEVDGSCTCDCLDYQGGRLQCKHVLAVHLYQGDRRAKQGISYLPPGKRKDQTLDLHQLWMDSGSTAPQRAAQGWR